MGEVTGVQSSVNALNNLVASKYIMLLNYSDDMEKFTSGYSLLHEEDNDQSD